MHSAIQRTEVKKKGRAELLRMMALEQERQRVAEEEERRHLQQEERWSRNAWSLLEQQRQQALELERERKRKQQQEEEEMALREKLQVEREEAERDRERQYAALEDQRSLQLRQLETERLEKLRQEDLARRAQQERQEMELREREIALQEQLRLQQLAQSQQQQEQQERERGHQRQSIVPPEKKKTAMHPQKDEKTRGGGCGSKVQNLAAVSSWGGVILRSECIDNETNDRLKSDTRSSAAEHDDAQHEALDARENPYGFIFESDDEDDGGRDRDAVQDNSRAVDLEAVSKSPTEEEVSTILRSLYTMKSSLKDQWQRTAVSVLPTTRRNTSPRYHHRESKEHSSESKLPYNAINNSQIFNNHPKSCWFNVSSVSDLEVCALQSLQCWRAEQVPQIGNILKEKYDLTSLLKPKEKIVSVKGELDMLNTDPSIVTDLNISVEGIEDVSFLGDFVRLKSLTLNVNKITSLGSLEVMAKNRASASMHSSSSHDCGLTSLSVKDNRLTDISPLKFLRSLQNLYLDSNRISDLSAVSVLREMRSLSASNNQLTRIPSSYFTGCESLQRLELFHNKIVSVDDSCFAHLPSLTHLDLGNNMLTTLSGEALSRGCPLLQTLILSRNKLTEPPCPLHLPLLKALWLNGNQIEKLSLWLPSLAAGRLKSNDPERCSFQLFLPSLQKLFLQDNQLKRLDRHVFSCCPLLQELDLSFNALHSVSDISYAIRQIGESLKIIHIQDNPLLQGQVHNSDIFHHDSSSDSDEGEAVGNNRRRSNVVDKKDLIVQQILRVCPKIEIICGNEVTKEDRLAASQQSSARSTGGRRGRRSESKVDTMSLPYRRLLQMLNIYLMQQHCLMSRSKLRKKPDNADTHDVDWDTAYMQLLVKQRNQLLAFASDAAEKNGEFVEWFLSFNGNGNGAQAEQQPSEVIQAEWCSGSDDDDDGAVGKDSTSRRLATLLQCGPEGKAAVSSLQRHIRGRKVRKKLSGVIGSIRYKDAELDELMRMQMGDDSWLQMEEELVQPMVYGDHVRRRAAKQTAIGGDAAVRSSSSGAWVANKASKESYSYGLKDHEASRPSTAITTTSEISIQSALSSRTIQEANADHSAAGHEGNIHSQSQEVPENWGISDPKVRAALAKRNAKITYILLSLKVCIAYSKPSHMVCYCTRGVTQRSHHHGSSSASATATAAATATAKQGTNTSTSGSFGGRPKTIRHMNNGAAKAKAGASVPAWMNKDSGNTDES